MNIKFATKYLAAVSLIVLLLPVRSFAESAQSKIDAGISHYKQQEYKKAAERFLSAQVEEPDNAALAYNLANSNYKSGKFAEAIQTYSRAVASVSDPALKQKAFYNIGNSLFRLGKLDEAVGAYKKALELNPRDMDAKFNLEFTREQLKKQEQDKKNRNRDSSKNKDNKPQSDPDNKDQENSEEQQPEEQNPEEDHAGQDKEQPENRDNKQKPQKNSATAQAEPQEGEMTREEAEQWLRSLKENLKKISQKQIREHTANPEYKGKDW